MSDNLPVRRSAEVALPESLLNDPSEIRGYSDTEFNAFLRKSVTWLQFGMKRVKLVIGVALAEAFERWGEGDDFRALLADYKQVTEVDRTTLWRWMTSGKEYLAGCTLQQPISTNSGEPISPEPSGVTADPGSSGPGAGEVPATYPGSGRTQEVGSEDGVLGSLPSPDPAPTPEVTEPPSAPASPPLADDAAHSSATSGRSPGRAGGAPVPAVVPPAPSGGPEKAKNVELRQGASEFDVQEQDVRLPDFPGFHLIQKVVRWLIVRGATYLVKLEDRDLDGLIREAQKARAMKHPPQSSNGSGSGSLRRESVETYFTKKGR